MAFSLLAVASMALALHVCCVHAAPSKLMEDIVMDSDMYASMVEDAAPASDPVAAAPVEEDQDVFVSGGDPAAMSLLGRRPMPVAKALGAGVGLGAGLIAGGHVVDSFEGIYSEPRLSPSPSPPPAPASPSDPSPDPAEDPPADPDTHAAMEEPPMVPDTQSDDTFVHLLKDKIASHGFGHHAPPKKLASPPPKPMEMKPPGPKTMPPAPMSKPPAPKMGSPPPPVHTPPSSPKALVYPPPPDVDSPPPHEEDSPPPPEEESPPSSEDDTPPAPEAESPPAPEEEAAPPPPKHKKRHHMSDVAQALRKKEYEP